MRGAWLTTVYGLDWPSKPARTALEEQRQREELSDLLDQLHEIGINTIFLQVRGRGDLLYPSDIEPLSPSIRSKSDTRPLGYDPLDFAIQECHKRDMTLHAWLVALPLGNEQYLKALPKTAYAKQNREKCILYQGEWYMDPAGHSTREHLRAIVRDLVARYPVDGVHLDYIRYPDHPAKFPDSRSFQQSKKEGETLQEWRTDNIHKIISEIHDEIKAVDESILLSCATIGNYRELEGEEHIGWTALESVYQDPKAWAEAGIVDFIVPMMYSKKGVTVPFVQDWTQSISVPVVAGLGAYRVLKEEGNWSVADVMSQAELMSSEESLLGTCFFRGDQIVQRHYGIRQPLTTHFAKQAVLPYPSGSIEGEVDATDFALKSDADGVTLSWRPKTMAPKLYTIYLKTQGQEPNRSTGEDLYKVTSASTITIPWSLLDADEDLLTIIIGSYNLHTRVESLDDFRLLYHHRPSLSE
ncbi:MAG: family 10 glycosylhydrolase [Porphyromonas sp.]|nr:family 10 glycosylhydrolase [Porphyromonas sp.]